MSAMSRWELQAEFSRQIKHRKQDCEEKYRLPHFSGLNRTQLPDRPLTVRNSGIRHQVLEECIGDLSLIDKAVTSQLRNHVYG
jgi:hypothetical protein